MATFLGIDIGKRSVRGALVRTSMRSFEIERYVEIPVSALTGAPQGRVYGTALRELSLGGLSLEGLLNFLVLPRDEALLLVHIDSEQSDLCVVRNGRVELSRTFDEGNESIRAGTRAVHNALHQSVMKYRAEG